MKPAASIGRIRSLGREREKGVAPPRDGAFCILGRTVVVGNFLAGRPPGLLHCIVLSGRHRVRMKPGRDLTSPECDS